MRLNSFLLSLSAKIYLRSHRSNPAYASLMQLLFMYSSVSIVSFSYNRPCMMSWVCANYAHSMLRRYVCAKAH